MCSSGPLIPTTMHRLLRVLQTQGMLCAITAISINGVFLTAAEFAALDTLDPDGLGNGFVLEDLDELDKVVVYTSAGFDRLQISNAVDMDTVAPLAVYDGNPFSITAIGIASVDAGDPVVMNFDVKLTDYDGDAVVADFNVTVTPPPPPPTFTVNDVTVTEGVNSTITFTVTLSSASDQATSVNYAVSPGTATTPGDYTANDALSGMLTFAIGETTKTVTLNVINDIVAEGQPVFHCGAECSRQCDHFGWGRNGYDCRQ